MYGFNFDPEVPAGYQDADLETLELEELARAKCAHGTPFGERCAQCQDCPHGYWHGAGCPKGCELEHQEQHTPPRARRTKGDARNTTAADYTPDQAGYYDNPPQELERGTCRACRGEGCSACQGVGIAETRAPLEELAPTLELDTGQIALRADVVERNGQQVFEELARPAKPAPLTFERDATEELARRQLEELRRESLEELTRESHERVAPWSPEELETLRRAQEPEPDDPDPFTLTIDGTPVERLTDAGPVILEPAAAELRAELEKHTSEELERIAAAPGAMPAARKIAAELVTIADHGKTLEAGGHTFTVEVPAPARARAQAKTPRVHTCACCGRELEPDHYVYSRHTRARFCWPGEGCQSPQEG